MARIYGVVIRVRSLPRCVRFYAEVMGLGEPVVDSSFWVEFELARGGLILALEQDNSVEPGGDCHLRRTAWCLEVDDLEAFVARLAEHGCRPEGGHETGCGRPSYLFPDPEGNLCLVLGRAAPAES